MEEKHPYSDTLNIEIIEADENGAYGKMPAAEQFIDHIGHMTAGAYISLADAVGGAAARATGALYVTQNCSIQCYQSTTPEDQYLYAKAFIRHRGSRTCIAAVELQHADGTVVADAQISYSKV